LVDESLARSPTLRIERIASSDTIGKVFVSTSFPGGFVLEVVEGVSARFEEGSSVR